MIVYQPTSPVGGISFEVAGLLTLPYSFLQQIVNRVNGEENFVNFVIMLNFDVNLILFGNSVIFLSIKSAYHFN